MSHINVNYYYYTYVRTNDVLVIYIMCILYKLRNMLPKNYFVEEPYSRSYLLHSELVLKHLHHIQHRYRV